MSPRAADPAPCSRPSAVVNLTTVAVRPTLPLPAWTSSASRTPSRHSTRRARANSSAALAPLIARTRPPGLASPDARPASRSSGATARAVTTSAATCPVMSSARPLRTLALPRPSAPRQSARNAARRAIGSTSVTSRSGSSIASTMPGRPAPDPRSTRVAGCGTSSATTAQLTRCLSQTRPASSGPISPRCTPGPASSRAYRSARGSAVPNTARASAGAGGTAGTDSRTAGPVSRKPALPSCRPPAPAGVMPGSLRPGEPKPGRRFSLPAER